MDTVRRRMDRESGGGSDLFESPDELDPSVRAAYLTRLGLEPGAPSVEALTMIMQRQVERVPYETF